jgi:hypothetical protein
MTVDEIVETLSWGLCPPKAHKEKGCTTCDRKLAAIAAVRALEKRATDAEHKLAKLREEAGASNERYLAQATPGTWQPTMDGLHQASVRQGGITGPVIFAHTEEAVWDSRAIADTCIVAAGIRVLRALVATPAVEPAPPTSPHVKVAVSQLAPGDWIILPEGVGPNAGQRVLVVNASPMLEGGPVWGVGYEPANPTASLHLWCALATREVERISSAADGK